jgi:hypothetical protein
MWMQPPHADGNYSVSAGWVFGGWFEGGKRLTDLWRFEPAQDCVDGTYGSSDILESWGCGRRWRFVDHGHRSAATVVDTVGEYGDVLQSARLNVPGSRDGHTAVIQTRNGEPGLDPGSDVDRMWLFGGTGMVRSGGEVSQRARVLSPSGHKGDSNAHTFAFTTCVPNATLSIWVTNTDFDSHSEYVDVIINDQPAGSCWPGDAAVNRCNDQMAP